MIIVCLIHAGRAKPNKRYEYIILADTVGSEACRSYQVFARNVDEFKDQYMEEVSIFLEDVCYSEHIF